MSKKHLLPSPGRGHSSRQKDSMKEKKQTKTPQVPQFPAEKGKKRQNLIFGKISKRNQCYEGSEGGNNKGVREV